MTFKTDITLTHIPDRSSWNVTADIIYYSERYLWCVIVPAGFNTDLASIPRYVWWLIPRDDRHIVDGAVIHDYLYRDGSCTRAQADMILRDAIRERQGKYWYRAIVWSFVRIFGAKAWASHRTGSAS